MTSAADAPRPPRSSACPGGAAPRRASGRASAGAARRRGYRYARLSPTCTIVTSSSPTSAPVSVVPMPLRLESSRASSKMRRLAACRHARELLLGAAVVRALVERLRRDPRRDLARLRAAHPVRDREGGRPREVGVLVRVALAPRVGARRLVDDPQHAASHCSNRNSRVADADPVARAAGPAGRRAAVRSRRCRWSSSCPRCRRRRRGRTAARGGRRRRSPRCVMSLTAARPMHEPGPDPELRAARKPRAAHDHQPPGVRPRVVRAGSVAPVRTGPAAGRPEVPQRAARDPQQEQVEHAEEGELEQDLEGIGHRGVHSVQVEPHARGAGHDLVARLETRRSGPGARSPRCRWSTRGRRRTSPRRAAAARSAAARRSGPRARSRSGGCGRPRPAAGRARTSCRPA